MNRWVVRAVLAAILSLPVLLLARPASAEPNGICTLDTSTPPNGQPFLVNCNSLRQLVTSTVAAAGSAGTGTASPAYTRIQDGTTTYLAIVTSTGALANTVCDPVAMLRCAIVNATGGDNFGPGQYMLGVQNIPFLFNGTTSDRQRDTTQFGAPSGQLGVAAEGSICNASVAVNAVSAITQLVALSGTTRVYVCSYSLSVATTSGVGTLQFSYGTGTTCGTGTGNLTGPISLVASTPDNVAGLSPQFNTPAGNALCLTATGTGASASGYVTYGQI
jgi:hypothetical protein